ncbi:MAG: retropepsin-like aspartic protease [Rubrivivax sp.]
MRRRELLRAGLGVSALASAAPRARSQARQVALAGRMGAKALLVIDGQTALLAAGEARSGVRLLALEGDDRARVEWDGRSVSLRLGAAPVALGGSADTRSGGREVVLAAGPGGHFLGSGAINGRPVQFMVDTGATVVALSRAEAVRLRLDLSGARPVALSTANGVVAAQQLTLSAVTLGDVTVANVRAVVVPAPMPHVLLGNSFLQRFQMRRENDVMRLELR